MINLDKFLAKNPKVQYFPEFDPWGEHNGVSFKGIKALAYEGADFMGKKTKVFAHIGYPENMDKKVPAMVLIHGGGGHPEDQWIKKWNERGYAAIAMDTTGFFPTKPIPYLYEGYTEGLERELVAPFYEEGYTVAPNNSGLADSEDPIENQWMYHALAQVILAHNILRSDERIDSDNIGVTGISWGGIISSILIGYDLRYKFAIPIYGSGYLSEGLSGICTSLFTPPMVEKWLAEKNFSKVNIPVMWLCWNADPCFSVNSNSKSYLATKNSNKNTCLSMLNKMGHSHAEGFRPEENHYFADRIVNGLNIPEVKAEYKENKVYYSAEEKLKSVKAYYLNEKLNYKLMNKNGDVNTHMTEEWKVIELDHTKNEAVLPENILGRYLEFAFENGIVLTSPYVEM